MFMGEYHHNIDDKGRVIVPSKFRRELGDRFVVTRGLDGCLFIYSKKEWEKQVEHLRSLPFTKKDARAFTRFFLSGATEVEADKQGRMNLPEPLVTYANLDKECIIIGVNERLEVWAKDEWQGFLKVNEDDFSTMAENLFDGETKA